jgi:Protein of unknown function DUF262
VKEHDIVGLRRHPLGRSGIAKAIARRGRYRYLTVTVGEAIERIATGVWDIPDFQREFVWKPAQVRDLADSLWRDYPIGALLLWCTNETGSDPDCVYGRLIADGLHRLTSLCLLCGREPQWLQSRTDEFRRDLRRHFTIYFDVEAERFVSAQRVGHSAMRPGLVPIETLLGLDSDRNSHERRLQQIAAELRGQGYCPDLELSAIANRLRSVTAILDRELLVTALYCNRDEVLEIFQRLNSRGMKFRRLLLKLAMQSLSDSVRSLCR